MRRIDKYKNNIIISRFVKIFSVDALVKISGLILLPVYLKLMTQEEYANYSYVLSIVSTFGLVFNFGLYVPQSKLFHSIAAEKKGALLYTINILLLGLLIIFLLPMYVLEWDCTIVQFLFSHSINYQNYRYIIIGGIIISVYSYMIFNFFMTQEQIAKVQTYNILRLVIGTGLVIAVLYLVSGNKAEMRLKAYFFVEALLIISFFYFYLKAMRPFFDLEIALKSLYLGLPIMMSAVLGIIINFGDKFFIEKYCSLADLSIYYLALTCASIIPAIFMTFQNIWLPLFFKEKDIAINLAKTKKTLLILFGIFIILAICIWIGVFGAVFFNILDKKYYPVLNILPIILASGIISCLTGLLSSYTIYWNMTYITILSGVFIACISLPLNFYGVKNYGIHGIVFAAFLINIMYFNFYYFFIKIKLKSLCQI